MLPLSLQQDGVLTHSFLGHTAPPQLESVRIHTDVVVHRLGFAGLHRWRGAEPIHDLHSRLTGHHLHGDVHVRHPRPDQRAGERGRILGY